MPKAERQDTRRRTTAELDRRRQMEDEFLGRREGEREEARGRASRLYGDIYGGYSDVAAGGGYDPERLGRIRGRAGNIAEEGGFTPQEMAEMRANYQRFTETGGVDRSRLGVGGYDPAQLAKVRGGYEEFARTGGFTPEQEGNFRRRATSGVSGIYNVLSQEAERRRALSGGAGFGGGELAQLARQASQRQAEAATGAEADLAEQIRRGRMGGLGGLAGVESDVAAGTRGTEFGIADRAARALEGRRGLESEFAAGRRAGAGMEADIERDFAGGRRAGLGGLLDLYGKEPGEVKMLGQEIIQRLGLGGEDAARLLAIMERLAGQPGVFEPIAKGVSGMIGSVTGGAGIPGLNG